MVKDYNQAGFVEHVEAYAKGEITERERKAIYWHMYLKYFAKERNLSYKLVTHPDVTEVDAARIMDSKRHIAKRTMWLSILITGLISWRFAISKKGREFYRLNSNRVYFILGVGPLLTVIAIQTG